MTLTHRPALPFPECPSLPQQTQTHLLLHTHCSLSDPCGHCFECVFGYLATSWTSVSVSTSAVLNASWTEQIVPGLSCPLSQIYPKKQWEASSSYLWPWEPGLCCIRTMTGQDRGIRSGMVWRRLLFVSSLFYLQPGVMVLFLLWSHWRTVLPAHTPQSLSVCDHDGNFYFPVWILFVQEYDVLGHRS